MELHKIQFSFIINDFNIKSRKKTVRMTALDYFGINTHNHRCDMLIRFAEQ